MKNLDKRLYDTHAILVKLLNTDDSGNGRCCTCGEPLTYKTADCGHYPNIPRNNMLFAWDLVLHDIQCRKCNRENQGEPEKFRDYLINKIGIMRLQEIEFKARKPFKWFKSDKEQLLKDFRKRIKQELEEKMFNVQIP